ncbi:MAG: methionine--tRNA ligase [Acidobacteriota bacterium]|nr:MAG: methionine--tRNA ligase [Acidobacteriota bacterium]
MSKKFYLTTPLYYSSGMPHVGHVYTSVITDALARYKRFCGVEVCALTGSDEHGLKIERVAREQGMTPQELTDRYSDMFKDAWKGLGIHFDAFIRTTEDRHRLAVQELAKRITEKGFIYLGEYRGNYCVSCEAYVPEGEQKCPDCGRETEEMTEPSYFFKLSAFEEKLLHFYESNSDFVIPQTRMNEIVSFVKSGLKDISISRTSFEWGIKLPEDPKHIFYVWFDALTGYLSGVGFGVDSAEFARHWPADVQLIGKDILRFHAVYWPAFLMAAGLEPPRHILVNGWWTVDGEKMSKSRGNFVTATELLALLPPDYVKYFLLREIPVGGDGDFSLDAIVGRVNADLANDIGNLANRTLKMIQNYFEGTIPESAGAEGADLQLISFSKETVELYRKNFDNLQISKALETVWELISAANRYIVANEPWQLARDREKRNRLGTVLYNSAEAVRIIAVLLSPIVPDGMGAILRQLGVKESVAELDFAAARWGLLKSGSELGPVEAVYPRLDIGQLKAQAEKYAAAGQGQSEGGSDETAVEYVPQAEQVAIDAFAKIDMRVAQILSAERIPKSSKLLKLQVDLGYEKRQVVAGIGEAYEPESLVGRIVAVVANLKPVKLMGVESNGMIVAASDQGKPVLTTFAEPVTIGTRLR